LGTGTDVCRMQQSCTPRLSGSGPDQSGPRNDNPGNLCFATTSSTVACITLLHLGLPSVVSDLGWGSDPTVNTKVAEHFVKKHIQPDQLLNEDGTLRQNDYVEAFLTACHV